MLDPLWDLLGIHKHESENKVSRRAWEEGDFPVTDEYLKRLQEAAQEVKPVIPKEKRKRMVVRVRTWKRGPRKGQKYLDGNPEAVEHCTIILNPDGSVRVEMQEGWGIYITVKYK